MDEMQPSTSAMDTTDAPKSSTKSAGKPRGRRMKNNGSKMADFQSYQIDQDVYVMTKGQWHVAKVADVGESEHPETKELVKCYMVHYPGWPKKYDEWVMADSLMDNSAESTATAANENFKNGFSEDITGKRAFVKNTDKKVKSSIEKSGGKSKTKRGKVDKKTRIHKADDMEAVIKSGKGNGRVKAKSSHKSATKSSSRPKQPVPIGENGERSSSLTTTTTSQENKSPSSGVKPASPGIVAPPIFLRCSGIALNIPFASDVIITVGSAAEKFYAHRGVLSKASPVLARALASKDSSKGFVTCSGIAPDVFEQVLNFIYNGSEPEPTILLGVYLAAHSLEMGQLLSLCERKISPALNVNNVCAVLTMVNGLNGVPSEQLKQKALCFFSQHYTKVLSSGNWRDFAKEHPALVREALNKVVDDI